jgi:hypothetical protein
MKVGDKVKGRFGATKYGPYGRNWYPGTLVGVHEGTYDVSYDDGDFEKGVLQKFVKLVSPGGTTSSVETGCGTSGDPHLRPQQSEMQEGNARKRKKGSEPHATKQRRPGVPAASADAQPETEPAESALPPMSCSDAASANTATSVPTPAAEAPLTTEVTSGLEAKNFPLCEQIEPGWYRISKSLILDSMPGKENELAPGTKFKARLPCSHLIKLCWPKEQAVKTFKFTVDKCSKCAHLARAAQP